MRLLLVLCLVGYAGPAFADEPWSETAIAEQSKKARAAIDLVRAQAQVRIAAAKCRHAIELAVVRNKRDPAAEALLDEMLQHIIRVNRVPLDTMNLQAVFIRSSGISAGTLEDLTKDGGSCHLIIVWAGMVARVQNDSQLAALVSHELAHLVHRGDAHRSAYAGLPAIAQDAAARLREIRADELGTELASRAGYDPLGGAVLLSDIALLGKSSPDHLPMTVRAEASVIFAGRAPAAETAPVRILGALRKLGY